jgi:hypothetical protein
MARDKISGYGAARFRLLTSFWRVPSSGIILHELKEKSVSIIIMNKSCRLMIVMLVPVLLSPDFTARSQDAPPDRAILPSSFRYFGFWLAPTIGYRWDADHGTYQPAIKAWKKSGANGVLITDHDLPGLKQKLSFATGYKLRLVGGGSIARPWELYEWLSDPLVRQKAEGIYFDEIAWTWTYDPGIPKPFEPFDRTVFMAKFDSVLTLCEKYNKVLALTAFSLPGYDSMLTAVRAYDQRNKNPRTGKPTTSMEKKLRLFMSGAYLESGGQTYLKMLDNTAEWAKRASFPMKQIILWSSPSCDNGRTGKSVPTPGCVPEWTFQQVLHAAELGFGGLFIYTCNGINDEHLDQLNYALWAVGLNRSRLHKRPSTFGSMRSVLKNADAAKRLGVELRSAKVPLYSPEWKYR